MPKMKSHKGLRKRIKITATGKVMAKRPGAGHLMSSKNAKRRRKIASPITITGKMARKFKIELAQ